MLKVHVTFSVLCHNIAVLVLGLDSTWKDHLLPFNPSFCHYKHGWKMSRHLVGFALTNVEKLSLTIVSGTGHPFLLT